MLVEEQKNNPLIRDIVLTKTGIFSQLLLTFNKIKITNINKVKYLI
jgi:hypothetical protein